MTHQARPRIVAFFGGSMIKIFYGATIFLSAFLLFQVQPIIGKIVLPWFGGSASVWTTCMLFFQAMLLLGYLYAHGVVRFLSPAKQGMLHLTLLVLSIATLPIIPSSNLIPVGDGDPALLILVVLMVSVGFPYLMLSTTGPLLQAWFAREKPGIIPYRLFALSNFGSMLALLTYPIAVEPFAPTRLQAGIWSAGYVCFAAFCGILAWRAVAGRRIVVATDTGASIESAPTPEFSTRLIWIALAACPSVLLLAVTNHLTQDVAPVPFLWILPLALYLLSFVICFERSKWYRRSWYVPLLVLGLCGMSYLLINDDSDQFVTLAVPGFAATLFIACMVCHGELENLKPDPRFLTSFYLMISVGGALGGLFVGVIAPRVFSDYYELPVGIVATAILVLLVLIRDRSCRLHRKWFRFGWLVLGSMPVALAYALEKGADTTGENVRVSVRNFYGSLKVKEYGGGEDHSRSLIHGAIEHGSQFLKPERRGWATSYYAVESGVGLALTAAQAETGRRVGVIGLGAGTLATYSRAGDHYVFYEINPLVIKLARSEFSYLADAKGTIETVIGDARLSLERQAPQGFDVLVVDAFSGDSIPVHLLTREAFSQYLRHLKPNGILVVHTSNQHLNLDPIAKLAADHFGKVAKLVESDEDDEREVNSASWVLITNRGNPLLAKALSEAGEDIRVAPNLRPWTDDYSSVFAVLYIPPVWESD